MSVSCCYIPPPQRQRWNTSCLTLLLVVFSYLLLSCLVTPSHAQDSEVRNCSRGNPQSPKECVSGETFLDERTGCCELCRSCTYGVSEECTVNQNTFCVCPSPLYQEEDGECFIFCPYCPVTGECIQGTQRCRCKDPSCHLDTDIYCENSTALCKEPTTSKPTTLPTTTTMKTPNFSQESLPPWGIGLIAIGIVIGIIIFASCFLCMGFFSMSKSESRRSSEDSENGLVVQGSFGTTSSFLSSGSVYPYLSSQSMLELLRNSNSQLLHHNSPLSSLHNSPVCSRAGPNPNRTVKLAKGPDKLSAIML